jgi:hypothetical protein
MVFQATMETLASLDQKETKVLKDIQVQLDSLVPGV